MNKNYINLAFILSSAWLVYSYCQEDSLLPIVGILIIIFSLLLRLQTSTKQYNLFKRMPLSLIIFSSAILGLYWRSIYPPPETAISPFPTITAAFQAGTIFASLLIWLKPFSLKNMYHIFFLAWLTVATSINISFNPRMFFYFSLFCLINLAVIILHTMNKPQDKKYRFKYYSDFILFSVLLITLSISFFYGISRTIYIFDKAFMNFMNDYVLPRNYSHFLRLDPRLSLNSPGASAWDRRPVLEITLPKGNGIYLKMQTFKFFDNGSWVQSKNIQQTPLPKQHRDNLFKLNMTMFTAFDDIIPSPRNVQAARGNTRIYRTNERTLLAEDEAPSHIIELSASDLSPRDSITRKERREYLSLPPSIAPQLRRISSEIIGSETDLREQVVLLRDYFHQNFKYSLFPDFTANNQGIMRMLIEKRPAYCSYFASGLTLLLRAADIPARVVTGLMITNQIDARKKKFLARVSDAHAWVEVLLPGEDPTTDDSFETWQNFDPTPRGVVSAALEEQGINIEKYSEMLFLSMLRFKTYVENIDKEKMKRNMLLLLVLIFLLMNAQKIYHKLIQILLRRERKTVQKERVPEHLHQIYHRYEMYLKSHWQETRFLSDTDEDILQRLKKKPEFASETLLQIQSFLNEYRTARFGQKYNADVEQSLQILINHQK